VAEVVLHGLRIPTNHHLAKSRRRHRRTTFRQNIWGPPGCSRLSCRACGELRLFDTVAEREGQVRAVFAPPPAGREIGYDGLQIEAADMFRRLSTIGKTMIDPELTVLNTGRRAQQVMLAALDLHVAITDHSPKSGRRFADLHRASRGAASCLEDRNSTRCFTLAVATARLSGNFLQRSVTIPRPRA
jgi:hypothetical protein